jgi:MerR family transcriptional regulator, thiopeptide resistance regulator
MHVSDTAHRHGRRIGEVARLTGLTVRTLRHYDDIGILEPAERTEAGYRVYADADLRRLYRILALRDMGLPLAEIASTFEREGDDPRPLLRRHLARIDDQLALAERLRTRVTRILDVLDHADEPSGDLFIEAIEVMKRMERHYTPEQLAELERRADALGPEGMRKAQEAWARLIAEVEAERTAGTDPADRRLDPLMERWHALVAQFTGGDPGIAAALNRRYEEEGAERASHGAMSSETMAYAALAMEARSA